MFTGLRQQPFVLTTKHPCRMPQIMVEISRPNPTLKHLLQDIKNGGGLHKADFQGICDSNPDYYGAGASDHRRKFQQARDRLVRRRTATAYKQLVEACGILPCAATVQDAKMEQLREEMKEVSVSDPKPKTDDAKPADAKKKEVKIAPSKTPPRSRPPVYPPPPSPGVFESLMSPTPSVTEETVHDDFGIPLASLDPTVGWTPDNPHKIPITRKNTVLPHGFCGMFSDSVVVGSYERDVYFIGKTIGGDIAKWKACFPEIGNFPEFEGRCVLVEATGLDYIQSDLKVLEESLTATLTLNKNGIPTNIANGIRRAFKKLSNYFKRDKTKHSQFYLFIYRVAFSLTTLPFPEVEPRIKSKPLAYESVPSSAFLRKTNTAMCLPSGQWPLLLKKTAALMSLSRNWHKKYSNSKKTDTPMAIHCQWHLTTNY